MPKKVVTWVLVADATHASVFVNDGPGRGLSPADEPSFKSGVPRYTREVVSDREGRSWGAGGVGRHGMDPPTDPKRHAEASFAREVAQTIGQAALDKKFDRLVLVAPPKALGDLRAELPKHAQDRVTREIPKDLVHLDGNGLARHLTEADIVV
jgi:protein required for attachment to host cells